MKKLNALLIVFSLIFIITGLAGAELYRWVDKDGVVHLSDVMPRNARQNVVEHQREVESTRPAEYRRGPKVELYITEWCPYCQMAREFFRSRGIPFTEYDIEKDKAAAARKNRLDKRKGVPFAMINGHRIHGYSPAAYEQALQRRQ